MCRDLGHDLFPSLTPLAGIAHREPHAGQDTAGDESGLQARPALRTDSSFGGIQSVAFCPLQDDEQLRSHDPNSTAGICCIDAAAGARENPDPAGREYWAEDFRVPGVAVVGCQLQRVDHQRASYLDLWPTRSTQEQGFTRACAASSVAG